ncbi:hypothetical protein D0865_08888 [Hortaea werneckii]|uniref:Uncharacterized protein n=1 Tax=Hortaea werneckii TaxID=91943 RepID=A0A3M7C4P6_HORWE|nr:hypothetical protein D0865_08888 [Hortaea werneckii]
MEQRIDKRRAEQNGENVGFAMDFRIEVVDKIGAQLEGTMRLGSLGYFKEAHVAVYSAGAPAEVRNQGAYHDFMAHARSHYLETCSPAQSALIPLIVANNSFDHQPANLRHPMH